MMMKRSPESALRFATPDLGSNEPANPSVTRTLLCDVPVCIRFVKLMVDGADGKGEPFCAQTRAEEKAAAKPVTGVPTTIWGITTGILMLTKAVIGVPAGIMVAFTRIPEITTETAPWAENVTATPLNTKVFEFIRMGCTVTACGPIPLLSVKVMPVSVLPVERRLEMVVLVKTVKFKVSTALGKPVHWTCISPIRSARPSA